MTKHYIGIDNFLERGSEYFAPSESIVRLVSTLRSELTRIEEQLTTTRAILNIYITKDEFAKFRVFEGSSKLFSSLDLISSINI